MLIYRKIFFSYLEIPKISVYHSKLRYIYEQISKRNNCLRFIFALLHIQKNPYSSNQFQPIRERRKVIFKLRLCCENKGTDYLSILDYSEPCQINQIKNPLQVCRTQLSILLKLSNKLSILATALYMKQYKHSASEFQLVLLV